MPFIIETPEDWFRNEQRDLYVIEYRDPYEGKPEVNTEKGLKKAELAFNKASEALKTWFEKKLPDTPLQVIGPSEYSGWICGGSSYYIADLKPEDLALFQFEWDSDSAWFVEIWPVADWRKRVDSAQLLSSPVDELQKLHWWDTPNGILLMSG